MFWLTCDQPMPPLREELAIEGRRYAGYGEEGLQMKLDCIQKAFMEQSSKKSHEAIFMECFLRGREELRKKYHIPEPERKPCKDCHSNLE
jgi:hypothetical protein